MKPSRMLTLLLLLVAAGCRREPEAATQATTPSFSHKAEQAAITQIQKKGGVVQVDETSSDKPAVLVTLDGQQWGDADLVLLRDLSSLGVLSLKSSSVTDKGLAQLPGKEHIQVLLLNGTHITDAVLKSLQGFGKLERLDLSDTGVTDAGMKSLARLSTLRILHLGGTQVTDVGLSQLKTLSGLEHLHVQGATRLTAGGLTALQRSLPNLKLHR